MAVVIDKIKGYLLHNHWKEVSSDPASASDGDTILNTSDDKVKMWYAGSWQVLHTLVSTGYILLESGDAILLESGDNLLLESAG